MCLSQRGCSCSQPGGGSGSQSPPLLRNASVSTSAHSALSLLKAAAERTANIRAIGALKLLMQRSFQAFLLLPGNEFILHSSCSIFSSWHWDWEQLILCHWIFPLNSWIRIREFWLLQIRSCSACRAAPGLNTLSGHLIPTAIVCTYLLAAVTWARNHFITYCWKQDIKWILII